MWYFTADQVARMSARQFRRYWPEIDRALRVLKMPYREYRAAVVEYLRRYEPVVYNSSSTNPV